MGVGGGEEGRHRWPGCCRNRDGAVSRAASGWRAGRRAGGVAAEGMGAALTERIWRGRAEVRRRGRAEGNGIRKGPHV